MNAVQTQGGSTAGTANYPTLFGLAFHPIKNRMKHALRRYTNLEEMKWKWNAPTYPQDNGRGRPDNVLHQRVQPHLPTDPCSKPPFVQRCLTDSELTERPQVAPKVKLQF